MKGTIQQTQAGLPLFETGQIWEMEGSCLKIGMVGKRLVHYKLLRTGAKRAPNSLSGKAALEKFLRVNKAVLLRQ